MSLTFVYGRAGAGKSQFCFKNITEKISNNKIYIITPEQFSYTSEKRLLDSMDTNASLNAEVLTFNRMAYRIISQIGGRTKAELNSVGMSMLIYNILDKNKSSLKLLGKSDKNVELISTVITELEKHKITNSQLDTVCKSINNKYLQSKLLDINLVYDQLKKTIGNKYINENALLTMLSENICKTDLFSNSIIYIDEFSGFTKQEYDIIDKLLKIAKDIYITINVDNLEASKFPDTDIFCGNKTTVSKLINIAKLNNIDIKTIHLKESHRFKTPELQHLEKNIYNINYTIYKQKVDNINLFLANNPYTEIENVANSIIELVREKDYKYKDISIITKNIKTYSNIIKAIFSKYDIPVYIDEKKELNQNIFVRYIISLLEIFSKNLSYESMFNYIKLGFIDLDKDDIYILENYCLRWGIRGAKWYNNEWNFGDEDQEELKKLNNMRIQIIEPLLKFKQKFIGKNKSAILISKLLYEFLLENTINRKLEQKIEYLINIGETEIANHYIASWNKVLELLDQIVLIFGEEKFTFDKYIEILKNGLSNTKLGDIPLTNDQIIVGDIDRSRSHKVRATYVIGVNDGVFPNKRNDEGFLNDNDRIILKENGVEIAKTTLDLLYDDNFNIYKALCTPEEKLFLSYVSSDYEGRPEKPSIIIYKIKKIFKNIQEKSDIINQIDYISTKKVTFENLLLKIRKFKDNETISKIWFNIYNYYKNDTDWNIKLTNNLKALEYSNIPNKLSKESINKLYSDKLTTSISKLEQYKSCPFSFYLKYGLKLSEKNTYKIKSIDTGSFMHEVIDEFFEIVREREINIKEIEKNTINKIITNIIEKKLQLNKNYIFTSSPKFINLTIKLKKVIIKSMKYIIEGIKLSDFKVLGTEMEFKKDAEFEPMKIDLENGGEILITGKIDRVDVAQKQNEKYIRIIDYKSSSRKIDLNDIYAGLQIQLITYLDAVTKSKNALSCGILYFNIIDPVVKTNKNLSDQEIENEIRKQFRMQGLVLDDIDIIKMMDKTISSGASKLIPVNIDTKGNVITSKSNSISKDQFENLQIYINKLIKQIGNEILDGNISLKPYYKNKNTPCKYCSYKPICQFNTNLYGNEYNYIQEYKKETILEMIKNN